jgi:hypothetical protein
MHFVFVRPGFFFALSFTENPNIYNSNDQTATDDKWNQLTCRAEILNVRNVVLAESELCSNGDSCSDDRIDGRLHNLEVEFAPLAL